MSGNKDMMTPNPILRNMSEPDDSEKSNAGTKSRALNKSRSFSNLNSKNLVVGRSAKRIERNLSAKNRKNWWT